jgi:hypothetical protein
VSAGPYPELLASRHDRPGVTPWEIERGEARRGEAWTDLRRCVMRVPFGGGEHGRLVRAHELMHARVSPVGADPFAAWPDLDPRAVECAEEFRVNQLLARAGFDTVALRDGSEKLSGLRMAEAGECAELLCFAAAIGGTAAFRDLVSGVRRVDAAMADACRALERSLRATLRSVPTGSLASTDPELIGLPRGFAVHTRQLAMLVADAVARGGTPRTSTRSRRGARPSPTGRFAPLVLDRSIVLDRYVRGGRAPRRTASSHGRRVVRPERLATDPARRAFDARLRRGGGVVVVDQSGSMSLAPDDLEGLLLAAPGAFVLGYSHEPGSVGVPNAWVLAERGRAARSVRPGNVGNGVDGPALRLAIAHRRPGEPLVWVCDGQVTDSGDHAALGLARDCAELALRHRIQMVGTLEGALLVLSNRSHALDSGQRLLLGRVAASVTPPS